MSEPDNTQPCRRCGMPGAVLHFPGGYLCQGGCDPDPIMRPIETDPEEGMDEIELRELVTTLRTRLAEVEADAAVMREALDRVIVLAKVVKQNRDSDWHDQISNLKFYEPR